MKGKSVKVYEDEPRAGTFFIAEGFDRKHRNVADLVEKYREDFEEFGRLKQRKVKTKGRPVVEFWLNEEQAILLGSYLRNSKIVREFKKSLVREFALLKKQLEGLKNHKSDPTYQLTRDAGKLVRKETTEEMKQFVAYAKEQGSKNADRYYSSITRMMNGMLFIIEGKYKNLREVMSVQQLMTTFSAEQIIKKGLADGMKEKRFYKDIYQDVKKRVFTFAELHGKSEVISKQLLLRD